MIRLKESIHVDKPVVSVFRYVSDFSHIRDWDPGVLSSAKIHPIETGMGSEYSLILRFGLFRPKMTYKIIEYQPFSKVVLKGEGDSFGAVDTIRFKESAKGTQIDYQADIEFLRGGNWTRFLSPFIKAAGKKAMTGLDHTLNDTKTLKTPTSWFRSGAGLLDYLADHAIIPGMMMFSRYGYQFSQGFWTECNDTLNGKKVVLTGGTSGIGKAAAFKLARRNAALTIIARNREKAGQVQKEIIEKTGNPNIDFLIADLSLMGDIRDAADKIRKTKKHIDILINNAGALFNERKETSEGVEQTFATDLLGVFYLTQLLKETLARSSDPRIINVASGGMYTQKIDVEDLENSQGQYNGAKAYARAKRGIVILTRIWAGRFKKYGISVSAMHPGWVDTPGIERSLPEFHQLVKRILRTPEQGADTIVWLAGSKKSVLPSGRFWLDRRPRETVVFPGTGESRGERQILWEKLNNAVSGFLTVKTEN